MERFLYEEAHYLDERNWEAWLDLYAENSIFHVPAWRDESTPTGDTSSEVSQIYHGSRDGLAERIARLESGKSVTTMPLPRTTHMVSNVYLEDRNDKEIIVHANWTVHIYQPRTGRNHTNFGRYKYTVEEGERGLKICSKTIILNNDCLPTFVDFYML